jgi:hypothetical protein
MTENDGSYNCNHVIIGCASKDVVNKIQTTAMGFVCFLYLVDLQRFINAWILG